MGRRYGQHFLRDIRIAQEIIRSARLGENDQVLEVGPGEGVLTQRIAGSVKRFVAVEIDPDLTRKLRDKNLSRVEIVQGDILKVSFDKLFPDGSVVILGNLPYQITSPLLEKVLIWSGWKGAVFMVQKEVAERICAVPHTRDYGILTVAVQARANSSFLFEVPPRAFEPPPQVTSAVISLEPHEKVMPREIWKKLMRVVRAAFSQRRKKVVNSLAGGLAMTKEEVVEKLEQLDIPANSRAENLDIKTYIKMAQMLGMALMIFLGGCIVNAGDWNELDKRLKKKLPDGWVHSWRVSSSEEIHWYPGDIPGKVMMIDQTQTDGALSSKDVVFLVFPRDRMNKTIMSEVREMMCSLRMAWEDFLFFEPPIQEEGKISEVRRRVMIALDKKGVSKMKKAKKFEWNKEFYFPRSGQLSGQGKRNLGFLVLTFGSESNEVEEDQFQGQEENLAKKFLLMEKDLNAVLFEGRQDLNIWQHLYTREIKKRD